MSDTDSPYPCAYDSQKADEIWAKLREVAQNQHMATPERATCGALFGNSPFLAAIAERYTEETANLLTTDPNVSIQGLLADLRAERPEAETRQELIAQLRINKAKLSLITAYADVSGLWTLKQVTKALSDFASAALELALGRLLYEAMKKGDLDWPHDNAEPVSPHLGANCGYFILGLGKLGAFELNYSSDIDLIALYDPEITKYRGRKTTAQFWIKITQDLMQMIEQRTMHGYVFRTDLRLRPDPGATPVAIAVEAAESYYHSMAVNWERSAMIKARVVAGDQTAGTQYLSNLSSWIWRRNMDFGALQDIAAIKNQINRHYGQTRGIEAGYNVKLGHGGIREIEFFAQVNQLLHAGRHPSLRLSGTVDALTELKILDLVSDRDAEDLVCAYEYLRTLEHRIQMVDDAQTHVLPQSTEDLSRISMFMHHDSTADMLSTLKAHTDTVSRIYDSLLPDYSESKAAAFSENLLAETLTELGFKEPDKAFSVIQAWRRGRYLALRTQRAKSLLEQCLPTLLEAFAQTERPIAALLRFDTFVSQLPAGVQLFSLLHSNPSLFTLLARVMGLAPALAETLAKKPELWDMVLEPSFFAPIENETILKAELETRLASAQDFQDILDYVRKFVAEQKFRAGVHLLESLSGVAESGAALTRVADVALKALIPHVSSEFSRRHGAFPDGGIAVLAMGKYGGRELTHTSDLDIVFLYHAKDMTQMSDGLKPLMPSQYFSRLGQNIITAITALTPEGRLFEVDTRLRPSGSQGPLVVTLKTFEDYYAKSAWAWEHMALTRARVILCPDAMTAPLKAAVKNVLTQKRDHNALLLAVDTMHDKLVAQFGTQNIWSVKHCRGGLVDIEFICQYLMLKNGHTHADVFEADLSKAIAKLEHYNLLQSESANQLESAHQMLQKTQSLLRLSVGNAPQTSQDIPLELRQILLKATGAATMPELEDRLEQSQRAIYKIYQTLIETPAKNLSGK